LHWTHQETNANVALPIQFDGTGQEMEKHMRNVSYETAMITPRRDFFGRVAAMTALGLSALATTPARAQTLPSDGPNWPGPLQGRHKQVVDGTEINAGLPLTFAYTFLVPNESATAVVVLRHNASPIALDHAMWEKYKIGESLKIIDPETSAPAKKNPFVRPKAGVLLVDDMAIDPLLGRGVVFGVCNMALQNRSKKLAANAGVSAEEALKDWVTNVIPGITVIPSGTWGVNRAQEAGCTYCTGA
jgi:hypothetical protein